MRSRIAAASRLRQAGCTRPLPGSRIIAPRPARALPRILLTGFEPFGGEDCNPSQEVLAGFDGRRLEGHRVVVETLPVCFSEALTALTHVLERETPVLTLALGLAGGRSRLSLERVALNLIDARIADNAGAQPVDVPVIGAAPPAYFTTLPVKAMAAAMQAQGVPAELSLSAGSFVCNAVFFALCHLGATRWPGMRVGFMHLPYLPAQAARHPGSAALDLATVQSGVRIALATALSTRIDLPLAGGSLC